MRATTTTSSSQRPPGSLAELHRYNRELVLAQLSDGPATQQALVRSTGLSATTVRALIRELLAEEIVQKQGHHQGSRGRPADWIALVPDPADTNAGVVAGIVCGHHTVRVVMSTNSGAQVAQAESPIPLDLDVAGCLGVIGRLLGRTAVDLPTGSAVLSRVVLGLPGLVDPAGVVTGAGDRWEGRRPAVLLSEALGVPATLENDTNLAALGEGAHGTGRGRGSVLYIKIGTGIGAALLIDGELAQGVRNFGSFFGHTRINPSGVRCKCGGTGCLETEASGGAAVSRLSRSRTGRVRGRLDLRELMATGDPALIEFRRRSGRLIGQALADGLGVLAPEVVVIGGLLAGGPDDDTLVGPLRRAALAGMPAKYAGAVQFLPARLGRQAEPLGANVLARRLSAAP